MLGLQCRPSDCDFRLEWFIRIGGIRGTYQSLDLVMGDLPGAQCQWVRNDRLRWSFLALNPHVGGGLSGTFFASAVTQLAVITGWDALYGSMGPGGHIRCLDLVMGGMTGAQWVRNDSLIMSYLA